MRLLLAHGADPEIANGHGFFPIHVAAQVGCFQCIDELCQFSPRQSMLKDGTHGHTPLHCVSSREVLS